MARSIVSEWRSLKSVRRSLICFIGVVVASMIVIADARQRQEGSRDKNESEDVESAGFLMDVVNFLWQKGRLGYTHVWPVSMILFSP